MTKNAFQLRYRKISLLALSLWLILNVSSAQAQGSAFTYQGRLTDGSLPANGTFQMQFALYGAASDGTQLGNTLAFDGQGGNPPAITVSNGVFTVQLDFGANPFASSAERFLQIQVKHPQDNSYTTLAPRQQLTSSPFSIRTISAGSADSLSNACVACVSNSQIGSVDGSKISGPVANATNAVTAGNVAGVVAVANGGTGSANKNFVDLTTDQTVGGNKTFTGILSGDGSGLRNVSGAGIAGNTALNPQRLAILRWYDANNATATRSISVGSAPDSLCFDGTFIYVANALSGTVSRIRAATGMVEGNAITVGSSPSGLVFDGTYVYVSNANDNNVMRIRAASGLVEGNPIAVGRSPISLAFDGTFVYAVNASDTNVSRIRAATGVVEGNPIPAGANPNGLAFDGTFIYCANSGANTVTRIRAATGQVDGPAIAVGINPQNLAFDGTFIYVTNAGGNSVSRIRAATGLVEGSPIAVGPSPFGIVFDGTFVWVTIANTSQVTRIRASSGAVEGSPLSVGATPRALAFDGTFVYVANVSSASVMRF